MDIKRVVLLVQPHEDNRQMYAEYLNQHGLSTIAVGDGNEALRFAAHADVVITGVVVPGIDGIELTSRLRLDDRTKNVAIIVLSAGVFPDDRARAERAGCDACLPMPCLPSALLREVRHWMLQRVRRSAMKRTTVPNETPENAMRRMTHAAHGSRQTAQPMKLPTSTNRHARRCGAEANQVHTARSNLKGPQPMTTKAQRNEEQLATRNDVQDAARSVDRDEISRRAYERYEERGREAGHDVDDWLGAERDLQRQSSEQ